jgi:ABC-2 type transport system permease protein
MTSMINLVRSEFGKLTTTRMPLAFLAVLGVIAVINGVAVAVGTDMDGSKAFISTAADQQSLMAFAANAVIIAALFGAIAAAREYGHNTVIATYLSTPRRSRAVVAQATAIGLGGAMLGLVGTLLTVVAVAFTLPLTSYGFMVTAGGLAQILAASTFAGACGAVLGAGIGNVVRNTGGAVAGTVVCLVIAPPVIVQLGDGAASWVPNALANVTSGVAESASVASAVAALALWALIPALAALWTVQHQDVA